MLLGSALKQERERFRVSVKEFAALAGITPRHVYNLERELVKNPHPWTKKGVEMALVKIRERHLKVLSKITQGIE